MFWGLKLRLSSASVSVSVMLLALAAPPASGHMIQPCECDIYLIAEDQESLSTCNQRQQMRSFSRAGLIRRVAGANPRSDCFLKASSHV